MHPLRSCSALVLAGLLSGCASTASAPYSPMDDPVAQQLARYNPQALSVYLSARQEAEGDEAFAIPWRKVLNISIAVVAYHSPIMGLSPSASALMAMNGAPALLDEESNGSAGSPPQMDLTALLIAQGQQQLQGRIEELEQQLAASMAATLNEAPQALASAVASELEGHPLAASDTVSRAITDNVSSLSDQWLASQKNTLNAVVAPNMALLDQYFIEPDSKETNKTSLLAEEIMFSGVTPGST